MNTKTQDAWMRRTMCVAAIAAGLIMAYWMSACVSLKRTGSVAGGAAGGAAVGSLAGPVGAIGGAAVGGALASAVVDADIEHGHSNHLEGRLGPPPPPPPWYTEIPWWYYLAALWVWLRRAHLMDALTGKEPRLDAILRALGIRTHKTPIPGKGGGA
jgi:hypothetical protein